MKSSVACGESRKIEIAPMTEHDLLEVVEIEEASGLSRWGWDAYHAELKQAGEALMFVARCLGQKERSPGMELAGFIASRLVANELHINNVAVRFEYRRAGIGSALLETVLAEGARRGAGAAFLEVRESNTVAQVLYAKCGFGQTGRRKGYYSDPLEDALVMSRTL